MVGVEGDHEPLGRPYYQAANGNIDELFSRKTGFDFHETSLHAGAVVAALAGEPDLRAKVLHHSVATFNAGRNGNKVPATPRYFETVAALGRLLGESGRAVADSYFSDLYDTGHERRSTPSSGAKDT